MIWGCWNWNHRSGNCGNCEKLRLIGWTFNKLTVNCGMLSIAGLRNLIIFHGWKMRVIERLLNAFVNHGSSNVNVSLFRFWEKERIVMDSNITSGNLLWKLMKKFVEHFAELSICHTSLIPSNPESCLKYSEIWTHFNEQLDNLTATVKTINDKIVGWLLFRLWMTVIPFPWILILCSF
jgi:hypothetical protein